MVDAMLHCGKHLLLTPAEMARADAASAVPFATLVERAGRAVARAARRRFGPSRTLVLCGPGHNGADGRVAARLLGQWGWPVRAVALDEGTPAEAGRVGLVIDAAFGAGLRGALAEPVADTLAAARAVLAVDVPSGLDGGTGQARGRVRAADLTVTFARLKPGHLLLPGRVLCGETWLADIGLGDAAIAAAGSRAWRNGPWLWRVRAPGPLDHKYTRGHVTVLGGGAMTGAARLAASAARRAGAGLVTLAAVAGAALYRAGEPGLIVTEAPLARLLEDGRRQTWVVGPGLGAEAARAAIPTLLAAGRTVVADADALTAFAGEPEALGGAALLTPHAGEFVRLFGALGEDRLAAARGAAARVGCVVLLKGGDTVIAAPDGRAAVNDNAPPSLATAGAGDTLAGIAAALLAQGLPAFEAGCAAAWLHGRAAVHAGGRAGVGLIAEDLAPHLPQALAEAIAEGERHR